MTETVPPNRNNQRLSYEKKLKAKKEFRSLLLGFVNPNFMKITLDKDISRDGQTTNWVFSKFETIQCSL